MSLSIEAPSFFVRSHSRAIDLDAVFGVVDYTGGAKLPPRFFLPYYPPI
jgi:hypothetical protein